MPIRLIMSTISISDSKGGVSIPCLPDDFALIDGRRSRSRWSDMVWG